MLHASLSAIGKARTAMAVDKLRNVRFGRPSSEQRSTPSSPSAPASQPPAHASDSFVSLDAAAAVAPELKAPVLARASSFDHASRHSAGTALRPMSRSRSPPTFCDRCAKLHQSGGPLSADESSCTCPCPCHSSLTVSPAWLGVPNAHSSALSSEIGQFVNQMSTQTEARKPAVSEAARKLDEVVRGLFAKAKVEIYGKEILATSTLSCDVLYRICCHRSRTAVF